MTGLSAPANAKAEPFVSELVGIIEPYAKNYSGALSADTKIDKIGIDSFDFVEIIFQIEEKYGVDVDYNVNSTFSNLSTIGDFASEVSRLVAAKSGA